MCKKKSEQVEVMELAVNSVTAVRCLIGEDKSEERISEYKSMFVGLKTWLLNYIYTLENTSANLF